MNGKIVKRHEIINELQNCKNIEKFFAGMLNLNK